MNYIKYLLYSFIHYLLPNSTKHRLRTTNLFIWIDQVSWELPAPLLGYRMKGPGVFSSMITRPYEPLVAQTICRLVQPGWICVDIGAHFGYFTLLMAHLAKTHGHVFSFEAHPSNFYWLQRNIELNKISDKVTLINLAITDGKHSFVSLYAPKYYTTEFSIIRKEINKSNAIEVRATSLDQFLPKEQNINFVKMDIEGAEYIALQGMVHILRTKRPICLIELHGEEGQKAKSFLQQYNYILTDLEMKPLTDSTLTSHILAQPN